MKYLLIFLASLSAAQAADKPEIRSGVSGSYCRPFDAPECRNFNAVETQRVWEKRQFERRLEDAERRERQRDFEYRLERDAYRHRNTEEYRR
jgi:hypothetical protein